MVSCGVACFLVFPVVKEDVGNINGRFKREEETLFRRLMLSVLSSLARG